MTRGRLLRVAGGLVLLALALAAAFAARGVGQAASAFRGMQAEWQRGVTPAPPHEPGTAQRLGEVVLGVQARSDVLRAYERYRAGVADVIPGTRYPQTRARYEAVNALRRLRGSLDREDRAIADVVLGVVYTAGAAEAGEQRAAQTTYALDAFRRAVLEDPANPTAKLDLEVLLRSEARRTRARARSSPGIARNPRQRQQDPRGPTAPSRAEGTGY